MALVRLRNSCLTKEAKMTVGVTGVYKAPTDMAAADPRVLARVGPGTESAALVTGVSADGALMSLRVFPDQQEDFSIRGIGIVDDPVIGSFVAGAHPEAPPITRGAEGRSKPMFSPDKPDRTPDNKHERRP
jgi:hypothetical protein